MSGNLFTYEQPFIQLIFDSLNATVVVCLFDVQIFTKFKTKQPPGNPSINNEKNIILNQVEQSYFAFTKKLKSTKNKQKLILCNGFKDQTITFCECFVKLSKPCKRFANELLFLLKSLQKYVKRLLVYKIF